MGDLQDDPEYLQKMMPKDYSGDALEIMKLNVEDKLYMHSVILRCSRRCLMDMSNEDLLKREFNWYKVCYQKALKHAYFTRMIFNNARDGKFDLGEDEIEELKKRPDNSALLAANKALKGIKKNKQ